MRYVVVVVLVLIIAIFASVIVVDQRQVAVVKNYTGQRHIDKTGIHFVWPFFEKVDYVFINTRTDEILFHIAEVNNPKKYEVKVEVTWCVVDPIKFDTKKQNMKEDIVHEQISKAISLFVNNLVNKVGLSNFNRMTSIYDNPIKIEDIGVVVDSIYVMYVSNDIGSINLGTSTK